MKSPRIKALNNEVNRRFHDLESQTRKASFETASLSARLESVEAEPWLILVGVQGSVSMKIAGFC